PSAYLAAAFRKGLSEVGHVEGQTATIESLGGGSIRSTSETGGRVTRDGRIASSGSELKRSSAKYVTNSGSNAGNPKYFSALGMRLVFAWLSSSRASPYSSFTFVLPPIPSFLPTRSNNRSSIGSPLALAFCTSCHTRCVFS